MTKRSGPREIALSAAWNVGSLGDTFLTTDGDRVHVIHRGAWSHGLGPDFRDALLLFNDREMRSGSVEIHLASRAWYQHEHHLDAAYNDVILHLVLDHAGPPTRRLDGGTVPVVVSPRGELEMPDFAFWEWDRVGGETCAVHLAQRDPGRLRQLLHDLGDRRLAVRAARIEARLSDETPAQVLWEEIMDGLGFSANRAQMVALARAVRVEPLQALLTSLPADKRLATALGILLGAAGFLPLSPAEAHLGGLTPSAVQQAEAAWRERGAAWSTPGPMATSWNLARVRPANHPVARLTAAASLASRSLAAGALLPSIVGFLMSPEDATHAMHELSGDAGGGRLGSDRLRDILASGILPFALGFASQTGNDALLDAVTSHWERLPAPARNVVTARAWRQVAGSAPVPRIGARGAQGLIHLDTTLCQVRRCYECPIAANELAVNG